MLDDAAKDGLDGLRSMFSRPGGEPAFFGKQEEAEMVATIRAALPEQELVFWGTDYEVLSDRELRRILAETEKPEAAEEAFQVLQTAADGMWDQFMETRSPQYIFSFGGDPALVRAVIDAWPDADAETRRILHTLEETLIINNLWMQGKAWDSNKRRANLQRHNFIEYWAAATAAGESPRLIAKFGGSHLVRRARRPRERPGQGGHPGLRGGDPQPQPGDLT